MSYFLWNACWKKKKIQSICFYMWALDLLSAKKPQKTLQVNLEIQKRLWDRETKDLMHTDVLGTLLNSISLLLTTHTHTKLGTLLNSISLMLTTHTQKKTRLMLFHFYHKYVVLCCVCREAHKRNKWIEQPHSKDSEPQRSRNRCSTETACWRFHKDRGIIQKVGDVQKSNQT